MMLQASWSRGKDLSHAASNGGLSVPLRELPWNAQLFWHRLQKLPLRASWSFCEHESFYFGLVHHLDDPHFRIPGQVLRYRQAWLGAEAGLRVALQYSPYNSSPHHPTLLSAADWLTPLSHFVQDSWAAIPTTVPHYSQDTLLERFFSGVAINHWALGPFSENGGALRRAMIFGMLWPGRPRRAWSASIRDSAGYTGAALAANAWLAGATATILTAEPPDVPQILEWQFRQLEPHSQIREIGQWVVSEFYCGKTWQDWYQQLATRCHYYPADHVVPNSAWIVGAILWGGLDWDNTIKLAAQDGFDPIGRSLIVGALLGLSDASVPDLPPSVTHTLIKHADTTFECARAHTSIL